MITPGQVADLLDPAVRSMVMGPFEMWKPLAAEVFDIKRSDRKSEINGQMSGHGYIPVKAAGAAYTEEEPVEGLRLTATHVEYGLATQVTESALEDDQFGLLKKIGDSLLKSSKHTIEKIAWDLVNNSFTAGDTAMGDGLALYNTAKLRLGVGAPTFANKAATDLAFSVASFKTALDTLRAQKDHNNLPHVVTPPYYIIVEPTLTQTVWEIVKSDLKQGTANNDKNYYNQGQFKIITCPYMTSTTNWHVWSSDHGQKLYIRVKPELRTIVSQATGNLVYQVRLRASVTSVHQFGIFGSNV